MSLLADLEGSLSLNVDPFVSAAESAASVWEQVSDSITEAASKLVSLLGLDFNESAVKAGDAVKEAGEQASGASPHFNELKESVEGSAEGFKDLLERAGLALGTFEVIKESLGAFSQIQDLQTSFTLISGSADQAAESIEKLKNLSNELAISTSDMLNTASRMAPTFGVGSQLMLDTLKAAADAAAGANREFASVAASLERVGLTGQVSSRQLVALGINMQDIATTMGVTVSQATELMKKGAQDAKVDVQVLIDTIERKFPDAAALIAKNLSGSFQQLENQLHQLADDIGKELEPVASDLIAVAKTDIIPFVHDLVESFGQLPEPVKKAAIEIGGLVAVAKMTGGIDLFDSLNNFAQTILAIIPLIGGLKGGLLGLVATVGTFANAWVVKRYIADTSEALSKMSEEFKMLFPPVHDATEVIDGMMNKTQEAGDIFKLFGITAVPPAEKALKDYGNSMALVNQAFETLGIKTPPTTAELNKLKDAFNLLDTAFKSHSISQDAYIKAAAGLNEAIAKMKGSSSDLTDQLTIVEAKFNVGKATLKDYAAAVDASIHGSASFQDAIAKQAESIGLLNSKFLELVNTFPDVEATLKGFGKDSIDSITSKLAALQEKLSGAFAALAIDIPRSGLAVQLTVEAIAKELDKLNEQPGDLDKLKTAFINAMNQMQKAVEGWDPQFGWTGTINDAGKALKNFTDALPETQDAIYKQGYAIASLNQDWNRWKSVIPDLEDALNALGVRTIPQLQASLKDAQKNFETMEQAFRDGKVTSDALKLVWQALHDAEVKLSEDALDAETLGLPDLEALRQKVKDVNAAYEDLASKGLLNTTTALEGNIEKLKVLIESEQQAGKDTSALQSDLETLTDKLKLQKDGWFALSQQLTSTGLSDFKTIFHDLIFDVGSLGAAFKQLGEDIVDIVINHIVELAMKPLLKALDDVIARAIDAALKVIGIGSTTASGVPITTPPISTTSDIPGTGTGTGTGTGSSSSNTVTDSLAGFTSSFTGAVSAITGIIGVFQTYSMQRQLADIEFNTRLSAIADQLTAEESGITNVLFNAFRQEQTDHLKVLRDTLKDIYDTDLQNTYHSMLAPLLDGIQATLNNSALSNAIYFGKLFDISQALIDIKGILSIGYIANELFNIDMKLAEMLRNDSQPTSQLTAIGQGQSTFVVPAGAASSLGTIDYSNFFNSLDIDLNSILLAVRGLIVPQFDMSNSLKSIAILTQQSLAMQSKITQDKQTPIKVLIDGNEFSAWLVTKFETAAPVS